MIGLHYVDQQYSEAQRATHIAYLKDLRPPYVNILGGAQYQQAVQFAHEVRQQIPETQVIFRHYKDGGDNGMWTRVTPAEFIQNVCIAHKYHETDWYIVTDNEANAADLTLYAQWTADVIERASNAGVKLAVGRFPTHNPSEAQINGGQLDAMWEALAAHPEHIWSPNVYFEIGNSDGLKRVALGRERMKKITGKTPTVVLGEYAYAKGLDPHKGYKADLQLTGAGIVETGANLLKLFLPDTPACWYCVGAWPSVGNDTFGADSSLLKRLKTLYPQTELPPPPPPEPPELPDRDSDVWQNVQLLVDKCRLRAAPFLDADILITVGAGSNMKWWHEPNYEQDGYRWYGAWYGEHIGWMALVRDTVDQQWELAAPDPEDTVDEPPADTTEPPVDPDDTTEVPAAKYISREEHAAALDKQRAELMAYMDEKFATIIENVFTAQAKVLLEAANKEHKQALKFEEKESA